MRVHSVIIETIRATAGLAAQIARQDRDLASQYRRALTSAALNVLLAAEAWGIAGPSAEVGARFRQTVGTLHRVVHPR